MELKGLSISLLIGSLKLNALRGESMRQDPEPERVFEAINTLL
jgi:hypothetical protein